MHLQNSLTILLLGCSLIPSAAVSARGDGSQHNSKQANDPLMRRQWGLQVIEASRAWAVADGKDAVIAVVDSGVDLGHPDLRSQILPGSGMDFLNASGSGQAFGENSHGTLVAGIAAAAAGNSFGIAGVAPSASIMPIRVCDESGVCEEEPTAQGIRYAVRRGADVINLSLGLGYATSRADLGNGLLDRALRYAWKQGAVIVAVAGNEGVPLCREPGATPGVPVLCVGATDSEDQLALYSNSDATLTTNYLVAPGGSGVDYFLVDVDCDGGIWSTSLRRAAPSPCSTERGFDVASGTSMAVPFVSGVAALLASQGLSNDQVVETILETADDLGPPGRDVRFGYGRVNAFKAVTRGSGL